MKSTELSECEKLEGKIILYLVDTKMCVRVEVVVFGRHFCDGHIAVLLRHSIAAGSWRLCGTIDAYDGGRGDSLQKEHETRSLCV